MINMTATVGSVAQLYIQSATAATTNNVYIVKDGAVVTSPTLAVSSVAGVTNLYYLAYTPTVTGRYAVSHNGIVVANIEVVSKSIYSFLSNIEDEALGSWTWNKQTGKLDLLRQDGTSLAHFDVVENLTTASRERTS